MAMERLYQDHTKWLQAVAAGDANAYTALYREYSPNIFHVAMLYSRNDIVLAEEFVQQVFVRIWEKRDKLREVRDMEDYIFILARNIIFDYFKKRSHEFMLKKRLLSGDHYAGVNAGVNETEERMQDREYEELLRRAVDQLPPQQKTVYKLSKEQGLSHEVIAEQLALSSSTVQTHMKLAMRSVRAYVEQHLLECMLLSMMLNHWVHNAVTN